MDLRDRIVDLAISSAEKLVHQKLDDHNQRELVGRFISEMEQRQLS